MIVAVDPGCTSTDEAEQVLHVVAGLVGELLVRPTGSRETELVGCTHVVRLAASHLAVTVGTPHHVDAPQRAMVERRLVAITGARHVGAAMDGPGRPGPRTFGPGDLAEGALSALQEGAGRTGGRLVLFPGGQGLAGRMSVDDVVRSSLIDRVETAGGFPAAPGGVVDVRGRLRPRWRDGRAVLVVRPTEPGDLAPLDPQERLVGSAP